MNSTVYSQLDSRWSSNPYPIKSSSFGGNGCGCCACTHVAMEQTDKANWTPENLRSWMISQGFAYAGQGTTWQGITATLKHIGHSNVVCVWNDPMSEAWKELDKGNRIGIILFGAGWGGKTAGKKVYWTAGGHYIAFTDYYVKDGKHYFYMKDSGGRKNSGVFSYEDSMYGVVAKVWIVERLEKSEPKPYSGELPNLSTSITSRDAVINDMMAFAKKYADDNTYKYKKYTSDKKTHLCPVCNNLTGKYKGWNCIGYASAICYHAGIKDVKCNCSGLLYDDWAAYSSLTLDKWKKRNGANWTLVAKQGTKIAASRLQAGDIVLCYSGKTYKHTCVYAGDGYIYDATSGSTQISKRKYSSLGVIPKIAFRPQYTKTVTTSTVLKKGSKNTEVGKMQEYLNWYGGYGLVVDNDFGSASENAVKAFQKDTGITQDGIWGSQCNAKAKEITK